jgi:DNA (cytosine-5)-methyltransferase 1
MILRTASLFSGAGGLDLGFKWKNFNIIFANDILRTPAATYSRNFTSKILELEEFNNCSQSVEHVYVVGDIRKVDFSKLSNVQVLIGGPPCQDFSIVRGIEEERRGVQVERGMLYKEFIRALEVLRPRVFIFENVPGLVSANSGLAYKTILEDFSSTGYQIIFSDIIDPVCFGVPQKRKRLVVVGCLESPKMSKGREVEEILSGRRFLFRKYPLVPIEVFEGRIIPDLQIKYREVVEEYKEILEISLTSDIVSDYINACRVTDLDPRELDRAFEEHESLLKALGFLGKPLHTAVFPDGSNCVPKEKQEVLERMSLIPPGENHRSVSGTKYEIKGRGFSMIYRRLHPLKPAYTLTAFGGGGTGGYHYERSRSKLTNRERARLQTFPDEFLFSGTVREVRAQIGESVPPLLAAALAEAASILLESPAPRQPAPPSLGALPLGR